MTLVLRVAAANSNWKRWQFDGDLLDTIRNYDDNLNRYYNRHVGKNAKKVPFFSDEFKRK
jgi:hypothetical protein